MDWRNEIDELHAFFEVYFLGRTDDLGRAEAAFGAGFTFAGPDGNVRSRAEVVDMLRNGHAHTDDLVITTGDHRLLFESDSVVVATYTEHHELSDRSNHRLSTVVFVPDDGAPNGVRWHHVQETWIESTA